MLSDDCRVTKYNSAYRESIDTYLRDEWTSASDIGGEIGGYALTEDEFDATVNKYLYAVQAFAEGSGTDQRRVMGRWRRTTGRPRRRGTRSGMAGRAPRSGARPDREHAATRLHGRAPRGRGPLLRARRREHVHVDREPCGVRSRHLRGRADRAVRRAGHLALSAPAGGPLLVAARRPAGAAHPPIAGRGGRAGRPDTDPRRQSAGAAAAVSAQPRRRRLLRPLPGRRGAARPGKRDPRYPLDPRQRHLLWTESVR